MLCEILPGTGGSAGSRAHFVFSEQWVAASSYQHVITTFQNEPYWAASPVGDDSVNLLMFNDGGDALK